MEWHLVSLGLSDVTVRRVADGVVAARITIPLRDAERLPSICIARGGRHVALFDELTTRVAFIELLTGRTRWASALPVGFRALERLSADGALAVVRGDGDELCLVAPGFEAPIALGPAVVSVAMSGAGIVLGEHDGASFRLVNARVEDGSLVREPPVATGDLAPSASVVRSELSGLEPWGGDRFVAQWPSPRDFREPELAVVEPGHGHVRKLARAWFRADAAVVRDDALLFFGRRKRGELLRLALSEEGAAPAPVFGDSADVVALAPDGSVAVCRGKSVTLGDRLVAFEYAVRDTQTGSVVATCELPFQDAVLGWLV